MAIVAPYHTISQENPPTHRNVYHNHDDCPDGKRILPKDKQPGKAGRPQCDECIKLD
jgi:hypothetical protein